MKFALAFLLLIGISCQIGRGDCAPDSIYDDVKDIGSDIASYSADLASYTTDLFNSMIESLTPSQPLSSYLPSEPESMKEAISSTKNAMKDIASNVGDSMKSGMNQLNQAVQDA